MLGAIIGDFCGSVYERGGRYLGGALGGEGCRFTDDSILTFATAQALLGGDAKAEDFARNYISWYSSYPDRGFGRGFAAWARRGELTPNDSAGNGSAMRVSPVGWAARSLDEALELARRSAAYTHSHPEGIKGAQAIAGCVFLLRDGASNDELRRWVEASTGYDLSRSVAEIIAGGYRFDATCPGSIPQAIRCFLDAGSFEGAVVNALSLNGDTDTQADMAGALAQMRFGVPEGLRAAVVSAMDEPMKRVFDSFEARFCL